MSGKKYAAFAIMLPPEMFRYASGLSALVLGQSFCGIAT